MGGIPSWVRRGQKIVCVYASEIPGDDNSVGEWLPGEELQEGQLYTIATVWVWRGATVVDLLEVTRSGPPRLGYGIRRFRPLVTRTQEQDLVEHFKPLLDFHERERA